MDHSSIRSYHKTRDCNAILSISSTRGVTVAINGVSYEQVYFNIRRPISTFIRGTFIISLSKHGYLRIGSTVHSKVDIFFKPPKELRVNIEHVTPWYDDGVWFDGNLLAALYPDGSVRVIAIKDVNLSKHK